MVDREIPTKKVPGPRWASPAYEALERKRTDTVGNPKDLSPEGGLQDWDGDSSRPVRHLSVSLWETANVSLHVTLCVCPLVHVCVDSP